MTMQPTNRLRWVKREIAWSNGWINKIEEVRVLQQLWETPDIVNHREEWRDIPTEEET